MPTRLKSRIITEDMQMVNDLLAPVSPGEILAEEFMKPMKLSASALARAIEVTPARVNEIVKGKRGISANTALRLARYFGTKPDVWMNLQQRFDLEIARRDMGDVLGRIRPAQIDGESEIAAIAA